MPPVADVLLGPLAPLGRRGALGRELTRLLREHVADAPRIQLALVIGLLEGIIDGASSDGQVEQAARRAKLADVSPDLARCLYAAARALDRRALEQFAAAGNDALGALTHDLVPPAQRRAQGQHYTPAWLVDLALERAGYQGQDGVRAIDPTCGSGGFLLRMACRGLRAGTETPAARERLARALGGYEIDPLAAAAARAQLRLALRLSADAPTIVETCDLADVEPARDRDVVVGNPPWVRWNLLSAEQRAKTLPFWKAYGLFSLSGVAAQLGGGEKDLAMLIVYLAADRLLRDGGTLAMVVTLELLKSKGAGEGFRRFRLGADGAPLGVAGVDDLTALRPFPAVSNKTALLTLTKGAETRYPVPYTVWRRRGHTARECEQQLARPIGPEPHSPWQTTSANDHPLWEILRGRGAYQARRGASVDPYGVYLVDITAVHDDGTVEVRSGALGGKRDVPRITCRIEPDWLFPVARGGDLDAWRCRPCCYAVLPQDPATRLAIPEQQLRAACPLTWAYLDAFRAVLDQRRSRPVQALAARSAFYATIGIGPYTFAPYRVTWPRMANRLRAAVLGNVETPLGMRPLLGVDTTSYVPLEDADEAHYLCALLNTPAVGGYVASFSAAGRGFGAPGILERIALPRFDRALASHTALAALGRRAAAGDAAAAERIAAAAECVLREQKR